MMDNNTNNGFSHAALMDSFSATDIFLLDDEAQGAQLQKKQMVHLQQQAAQEALAQKYHAQANAYPMGYQPHSYMAPQVHEKSVLKDDDFCFEALLHQANVPNSNTSSSRGVKKKKSVTKAGSARRVTLSIEEARKLYTTQSGKLSANTFINNEGRIIRGKQCTVGDCHKRAQSQGKCKAHGGGARCVAPGCTKSSQGDGKCRTHGGGKRCKVEGCNKGRQRSGVCYQHGGTAKKRAKISQVDDAYVPTETVKPRTSAMLEISL